MVLMRDVAGPHVVIAPKSTLSNWVGEFKRWCPSLVTICLIGSADERVSVCVCVCVRERERDVCYVSVCVCVIL